MSIVKLNNRGVKNATAFGSITGLGNLIFISRSTASSSSSVSITSGIDSTYKEYIFVFNNIHASTQAHFQVNFSADGGSNYNVTKTTSFFFSSHNEAGDSVSFSYQGSYDLSQSTSAQPLGLSFSSDSDGIELLGDNHNYNQVVNNQPVNHIIEIDYLKNESERFAEEIGKNLNNVK